MQMGSSVRRHRAYNNLLSCLLRFVPATEGQRSLQLCREGCQHQ